MKNNFRECLACQFNSWKTKMANCIWEIIAMNYKPTIEIEATKKFYVLSLIY